MRILRKLGKVRIGLGHQDESKFVGNDGLREEAWRPEVVPASIVGLEPRRLDLSGGPHALT